MANDRIDLALFGGLTYVQARRRARHPARHRRHGGDRLDRVLLDDHRPGEQLGAAPKDLRGRTFAFGSPSSTSGSLYPALMLRRAGIDFRRDLGRSTYTGGHDATAAAVASGG